jgi:osmotically-inducible protein OsmY
MRLLTLACALIVAVAGSGQAATVGKPPTPSSTATARRLPDSVIEQKIRAKLAKSKIGRDKFTVKVQNGVAYWEGKTDVIQHKGAATRMAKTAGAVAVVNNIQISDAARLKAAHNLSGAVPRAQVKHADPNTPPSK